MVSKLGDCPGRLRIFHSHETLRPLSQCALDILLDTGSGSGGLETAMTAAAAQQATVDHGKVPYLACKAVATNIQVPVDNERSANTSPDSEHHDIAATDGGPAHPLGEERAVCLLYTSDAADDLL